MTDFPTENHSNLPSERRLQIITALTELYRALKSVTFYPEKHPLREENRQKAFNVLKPVVETCGIELEVTRKGFVLAGDPVAGGEMVRLLAHELFIRRVRTVTFSPALSSEDLNAFIRIAAVDPQETAKAGGMKRQLTSCGTTGIKIVDMAIFNVNAFEDTAKTYNVEKEDQNGRRSAHSSDTHEERALHDLLNELDNAPSDAQYVKLASLLAQKAHEMKRGNKLEALLPALHLLVLHVKDERRNQEQRECALFTLDQAASGAMSDFLLRQMQTALESDLENYLEIVRILGSRMAAPIFQNLLASAERARRPLAKALVRIGYPAVSTIISNLEEAPNEIVHEAIGILGEIGSRDALSLLNKLVHHQDENIAMDALRAMVRIGGSEVETVLLNQLNSSSVERKRQIIYFLGHIRSRAAVPILVELLLQKDTFLRQITLKAEAVTALGRIGDPRVTSILIPLLKKRKFIARKKWLKLQIAIIGALALSKDPAALPALKNLSKRKALSGACYTSIAGIERCGKGINGH